MAHHSLKYSQTNRTSTTRRLKDEWFTASNYLRVFAAVIMRGLVNAKTDVDFFAGVERGAFKRTGAKKVVGLSLNQYQQLLRYMYLVDARQKKAPSNPEFDKLFHVRPLVTKLQQAYIRWMTPGKNNGVDEGGIYSKHRWLRTYNPSKPHKYFIEVLMACCSESKFCWAFFVTESSTKTVPNRHRDDRVKAKYIKVRHYQREFSDYERQMQDRFGPATAQMMYFARVLRQRYPSNITYRIFSDRRWDSLVAIVLAKKAFNVSYTTTVKMGSRFHILRYWTQRREGRPNAIVQSKKRNRRGKYRAACTTVYGVRVNTALWNDSSLLGAVSADLGSEEVRLRRRYGRHVPTIACPRMHFVRSNYILCTST